VKSTLQDTLQAYARAVEKRLDSYIGKVISGEVIENCFDNLVKLRLSVGGGEVEVYARRLNVRGKGDISVGSRV
jgi:hypothetical protein